VSAFLFLFLTVGHMSAYPWSAAGSPRETRLVDAMKSTDFIFMGEHSTYWGLYFGWGLLVGLLLFAMTAMLWLLSDLARLVPRRVAVMTGLVSATCGIGAYLSYRFFYVPPFLCFAANCGLLLIVTIRLLSAPVPSAGAKPANS
jgi:hypothetical protein